MDGQFDGQMDPIEYEFESSYQDYPETIDYSQNYINTKNPSEMTILQRRMAAGQPIKLPDEATISDALWESFKGTFLSDIGDDVTEKAKTFRFLWEDEDDGASSSRPAYGVAKNIMQLAKLN